MAKSWQELKKELEEATRKIMVTCPDEIKRFHYGIITHSDAGKHAINQYFGHMEHTYDWYVGYAEHIHPSILRLAADPDFELKHVKKMLAAALGNVDFFAAYGGQKSVANYANEVVGAFDTVQTKEEFVELLKAFQLYVSRLYAWFHWYFPWGLGPSLFQRVSPEDIKEIKRLSQIS